MKRSHSNFWHLFLSDDLCESFFHFISGLVGECHCTYWWRRKVMKQYQMSYSRGQNLKAVQKIVKQDSRTRYLGFSTARTSKDLKWNLRRVLHRWNSSALEDGHFNEISTSELGRIERFEINVHLIMDAWRKTRRRAAESRDSKWWRHDHMC